MKRAFLAAWMISAILGVARAQTGRDTPGRTTQTATIRGRVVADDTGDPLPNARVAVSPGTSGAHIVLSDAEGRFTVPVGAGRHTITASKTGYARRELTVTSAGDAGDLRLPRGAVISGRVLDEFGDPMVFAGITVETAVAAATAAATVATTETDDRGEYRVGSLPAGSFVVSATMIGQTTLVQVGGGVAMIPHPRKVFYPNAATPADAEALRLQPGDDHPGIDFRVPAEPLPISPLVVARAQQLGNGSARDATPQGTGIIRGRVVSTDGRSVGHARVQLQPTDAMQMRFGLSDDAGQFEFRELLPGKFRVVASKTGYSLAPMSGTAGPADRIAGQSIDLANGEIRERVELRLAPWGAVTGRILDEYGDPLEGARVQLLALRYEAGRRRLVPAGGSSQMTDDLGRYRVYAVPPGRYAVSAAVGAVLSADLPGYGRSYYPGTLNAVEAQFVSIGLSENVAGIDFPLSRLRTARVSGTLLNAAGEPTMGGSLMLMPSQRSSSVVSVGVGARIENDGRFEFPNVAPGQYVIQAYRGRTRRSAEGEFGSLPVVVNAEDVTGLVLQTSSGSSISGRFVFDTGDRSKLPRPTAIELSPIPVDADRSPAQVATADVDDDWTFEMTGIAGPRRLQVVQAPAGWALKETRVNGIDVTDRPLPFGTKNQSLSNVEVVLTDRINTLSGTIADDGGRPAAGAFLVVFATDRDRWYPASRFMRRAMTGADGTFTVAGLPFGSYYATAVERLPSDGEDGWQDPEFLDSLLPAASTVTLAEGEKQILNLRLKSR